MMKSYFSISIIALSIACSTQTQTQQTPMVINDQDAEIVRNLKTVLLPKAYDEQDTVLLSKLLHEKYQLVDDQGTTNSKTDELAYVSQYKTPYDSYSFEIIKLEIFENGTAMIFGTGTISGKDVEGSYTLSYRSTDTFVKEDGAWKAISSHVSGVEEVRE